MRKRSRLYSVKVMHRRLIAPFHHLSYRVIYAYVDLDDLERLTKAHRLLRLPVADYGPAEVQTVPALQSFVRSKAGAYADDVSGPVCLLSMPSLFGKRFNPISLFVCHDAHGAPAAVVYEVRNTFGEYHHYAAAWTCDGRHNALKQFHVSPFLDMQGHYRFALKPLGEQLHFSITKVGHTGAELYARMTGDAKPLSDAALRQSLIGLSWQGVRVLFGIHFEALKLWIKGARFYRHPEKRQSNLQGKAIVPPKNRVAK